MKKFAFTLSELMMALAILGIVAAITLPRLNNSMPSHNKMMMKKAYYTIEDVVSELISDEKLYPELGTDGTKYVGFDNISNACSAKSASSTEGSGKTNAALDSSCEGLYKFPKLFAQRLNIKEGPYDVATKGLIDDEDSVSTGDNFKKFEYILGMEIKDSVTIAGIIKQFPMFDRFVGTPMLVSNTYTAFKERPLDNSKIASLVVGRNFDGLNSNLQTSASGASNSSDSNGRSSDVSSEIIQYSNNSVLSQAAGATSDGSIRDHDMAAEMIQYSNSNILSQAAEALTASAVVFTTVDGLTWLVEGINRAGIPINVITVDVNGAKGPNCYQGSSACSSRTKDFDQFVVVVNPNGKIITVDGQTWFDSVISIDSSLNGN